MVTGGFIPVRTDLGASFPINSTTNVLTLMIYASTQATSTGVRGRGGERRGRGVPGDLGRSGGHLLSPRTT